MNSCWNAIQIFIYFIKSHLFCLVIENHVGFQFLFNACEGSQLHRPKKILSCLTKNVSFKAVELLGSHYEKGRVN